MLYDFQNQVKHAFNFYGYYNISQYHNNTEFIIFIIIITILIIIFIIHILLFLGQLLQKFIIYFNLYEHFKMHLVIMWCSWFDSLMNIYFVLI